MAAQNRSESLEKKGPGQDGQTLSEYALILMFIALAAVGALTLLGSSITGFLTSLSGSF